MSVLNKAKEFNPQLITKSSIMLGLGETDEQVEKTLIGIDDYIFNIMIESYIFLFFL